jgi:muramoyltetrapeptide carboxypeptidase
MLTQLRDSQSLRDVQGIIFGTMAKCEAGADDGFTLEEVLLEALKGFEGPIATGLSLGHSPSATLTLPLGSKVLLAPEEPDLGASSPKGLSGRLHLLELGVSDDLVVDLDA